jgi:Na+(H+)/acetate symporter ActP
MNLITIAMFAIVLLVSFGITAWAARRTHTTADFYAAGKGLTAAQNGLRWLATGARPPLFSVLPG